MLGKPVLTLIFLASAIGAQAPPSRMPVLAWEIQKSGTEAGLRSISAVDENTAWAGGALGTILRTVDGGKTWSAVPVPGMSKTDFRDIEAFDAQTAVAMGIGRPAKIFRTENGGSDWTEVYSSDAPGIFLDAIAFADAKNGWAIGDPMEGRFFLLSTDDGGKTWQELPSAKRPAARGGEGAFAASGTCLAVRGKNSVLFCTGGPAARLFRTSDGGDTWVAAPLPLLAGEPSFGAFGLAFSDDNNGIAVGGDYKNEPSPAGNAAVTANGGATWAAVSARPPAGFRECAAFVPKLRPALLIAVGPSGSDYSLDRGVNWAPIPGPAGWHSLSIAPNGRCGWAVGKGGLIARIRF
jgi:photosystem II stability/assembly factor-like uncharacterized protein